MTDSERAKIEARIEELEIEISDNSDIVLDRDLEDVHESAQEVIDNDMIELASLRAKLELESKHHG